MLQMHKKAGNAGEARLAGRGREDAAEQVDLDVAVARIPTSDDAKLMLFGLDLASAISSGTFFTGSCALATRIIGIVA